MVGHFYTECSGFFDLIHSVWCWWINNRLDKKFVGGVVHSFTKWYFQRNPTENILKSPLVLRNGNYYTLCSVSGPFTTQSVVICRNDDLRIIIDVIHNFRICNIHNMQILQYSKHWISLKSSLIMIFCIYYTE